METVILWIPNRMTSNNCLELEVEGEFPFVCVWPLVYIGVIVFFFAGGQSISDHFL